MKFFWMLLIVFPLWLTATAGVEVSVDAQGESAEMVIDSKGRALDYEEAFRIMKRRNPDGSVYAVVDGRSIDRIIDVKVTANHTLVVLTTRHGHREEQHVVRVEDIEVFGERNKTTSPVTRPSAW